MKNVYLLGIIVALVALIFGLLGVEYVGTEVNTNHRSYHYALSAVQNEKAVSAPFMERKQCETDTMSVPEGHTTASVGKVQSEAAFAYRLGGACIEGTVSRNKMATMPSALTVTAIEPVDLPPLDAGMVNVTGEQTGYRMLPHGMVFSHDISVVLPYDSTLLPMGFTPEDIHTYYYNEQYGKWMEIERDSVSSGEQLVYSRVNHFTDFINAVIKTPEMPEVSAYTPTSIKELKAANPLEGLQLMQPPTANNNGTANLSYPLEIPAGRQGMQPNLALTYNSAARPTWFPP